MLRHDRPDRKQLIEAAVEKAAEASYESMREREAERSLPPWKAVRPSHHYRWREDTEAAILAVVDDLAALSAEPEQAGLSEITADEWEAIWYAFDQGYKNLDDGFSQPRDSNRAVLQEARRKLEIAHAEQDLIEELKWQKITLEAELGQERHIRQRLQEELGYVREALAEAGLHYDENYGRPIRELIARADREPEPVEITGEMVERAADMMHRAYTPDEGDDLSQCWRKAMRAALAAALSEGEKP